MNRRLPLIALALLLVACSNIPTSELTAGAAITATLTPQSAEIATPTSEPTSTPTLTPEPTSTPTPIPLADLEGGLFFDYNGSGLREDTEPPIADFGVCAKVAGREEVCTETDENGRYVFEELAPVNARVFLRFVDPNADNPALAFRYINIWKEAVVIPSHEKNGVQVPEQRLNDTDIVPIAQGVSTIVGDISEIGLMQGFLTSPFLCDQDYSYSISLWYDHDLRQGFFLNYQGSTDPYQNPAGVAISSDNHDGTDFEVPDGVPVVAMAPGVVNFSGEINTWHGTTLHVTIDHLNRRFATGTGHHSVLLVDFGERVLRGQIIALSGHSGTSHSHVHLNLHHYEAGVDPPPTMDPFGVLYDTDDVSELLSYWTVHNQIVCSH